MRRECRCAWERDAQRSRQRVARGRYELPQARPQRDRGLRDQPRLLADLFRRRRAGAVRGLRESGVRRGDQLHRHRQRLRQRRLGDACWGRCSPATGRSELRARDKGLLRTMSPTDRGLSAAQIHKQIDASLERLKTDYVDLYQCHRYDADTPLEETMAGAHRSGAAGQGALSVSANGRCEEIEASFALAGMERGSRASRSIRCCGGGPRRKVIPLCAPEASRRSSGRRSRKACSLASTARASRPRGLARREREHERLHRAGCERRCWRRSSS